VWPKVGAVAIALAALAARRLERLEADYLLRARSRSSARCSTTSATTSPPRSSRSSGRDRLRVAVVIGTLIGARGEEPQLRSAVGSMITGLMTMPSIAWFPAAIVLFGLKESAILFVIVIGAAPSVANGFIAGVDNTPPILVRAARMLGAKGWSSFRHVVLPAALPTYIGGLKQGWAFAWRSLLAGELLVQIAGKESLGRDLDTARQFADYKSLYATMIVILVIGIVVDSLIFGQLERRIRRRYGLIDAAAND
jgi:NitT/TauT family transport system permease protein